LAFGRLGERGDVVRDDGSQVLDPIGQSQASSWEIRRCLLRRRASATLEK
jgi:hypothetical protein